MKIEDLIKDQYIFGKLKSDGRFEQARFISKVNSKQNEIIVETSSGVKCHAKFNEELGFFEINNVFGVCDSKVYTFKIRQGSNVKEIEINAKSYEEALKNVKNEAKKLRFKGKRVESKFDHNKLNTRE